MANIKVLDDLLANKIAAGEVVEKCASVVKELVENSIDAGSDEIKIDLIDAGTKLIRVTDNGKGMDKLTLERLRKKVFQPNSHDYAKSNKSFNGIGVQNVYQRMKLIYGEVFQMKIDSIEGEGTTLTFHIPVDRGE